MEPHIKTLMCSSNDQDVNKSGLSLVAKDDTVTRNIEVSSSKSQPKLIQDLQSRIDDLEASNKNLMEESSTLRQRYNCQIESFASMVHELRTPLNCIFGITHLLLLDDGSSGGGTKTNENTADIALSDEHRESIELIQSSCHILRAVVDDVLDLSKLESGAIQLNLESVSVRKLIKTIVDSCSAHAKQTKEVSIRTTYDEDESFFEVIETDSRLLTQVLFNLIGNAIKFSYVGGVVDICVSFKASESSNDASTTSVDDLEKRQTFLCICVKDHGKGIDKDHLSRIFQPFQQEGKIDATEYGPNFNAHGDHGTGLGLTIAKNIVGALSGTLSVDSELGKWSEFVVMLPQKDSAILREHEITFRFFYKLKIPIRSSF